MKSMATADASGRRPRRTPRSGLARGCPPYLVWLLAIGLTSGLAGARGASAQTLLSDNFSTATPGPAYTAAIPGSAFSAVSGNVDVIGNILNGAATAYSVCPDTGAGLRNCLDLNGTIPGAVRSNASFNLTAGVTYDVSISAAGNVPDSSNDPYAFTVSLGASGTTRFVVPAGGSFQAEPFTYTPTADQTGATLTLASATDLASAPQYGALIGDVTLSAVTPATTPLAQFYENFDGAMPGSNVSGAIAGSLFTVSSGNADVFGDILNGASAGFYSCPEGLPAANNCIDLNGDVPGAIQTASPFLLLAGTTYQVSFQLAGNIDDGTHTAYTLNAALGGSGDFGFSAAPGSGFTPESFLYTPTTNENEAELNFISTSILGNQDYGPMIDDISVTALPEPGSAAVLLTALAGLCGIRRRR